MSEDGGTEFSDDDDDNSLKNTTATTTNIRNSSDASSIHVTTGHSVAMDEEIESNTITSSSAVLSNDEPCWVCSACGNTASRAYMQKCLEREKQLVSVTLDTYNDINNVISEHILHASHYLLFWAMNDLYLSLSASAQEKQSSNNKKYDAAMVTDLYQQALIILLRVIELLEFQLPAVHHEKVVYYDRLGQLAVAVSNPDLAKQSFLNAYNASCLSSGKDVIASKKLLELATNTPRNITELVAHYSRNNI
jgi:hypothetical protein